MTARLLSGERCKTVKSRYHKSTASCRQRRTDQYYRAHCCHCVEKATKALTEPSARGLSLQEPRATVRSHFPRHHWKPGGRQVSSRAASPGVLSGGVGGEKGYREAKGVSALKVNVIL